MHEIGTIESTARLRRVRGDYARAQRQLELLAQRFERLKSARLDPVRHELDALGIQLAGMERLLGELRPHAAAVARGLAEWRAAYDPRLARPVAPIGIGSHANLEKLLAQLNEDLRRGTAQFHATGKRVDRLPRLFRRLAEGLFFAVRYMEGSRERDH